MISFIESFLILLLAFVINYFGAVYAHTRASNPVEDIILSNIPTFNVDGVFIWGPFIFWIILSVFLLSDPKRIPFTLKSVSLFILIRSFFVSLTHLGPFPDRIELDVYGANLVGEFLETSSNFAFAFTSGSDLFFSGHTGVPFLMALVFWKDKWLRYFCLATSVFFGVIVLLGHLHYTIDVASAFFITFTIWHIARYIFKADWRNFSGNSETSLQAS